MATIGSIKISDDKMNGGIQAPGKVIINAGYFADVLDPAGKLGIITLPLMLIKDCR